VKFLQDSAGRSAELAGETESTGTSRCPGIPGRGREQFTASRFRHFLIAIFFISVAVYLNALFNDFTYDDYPQILDNPWIRDFRYLPRIFSSNAWGFYSQFAVTNYYRPLMYVLYSVSYHLFGLAPWGYHLTNVLFHAGNSIMVFVIASKLACTAELSSSFAAGEGRRRIVSGPVIAALFFAAHPVHTEAVTWAAGLPDLSFTFFYLLSFYYHLRSREADAGCKRFCVLSAGMFFLAALCKETALTLPLIILIYDFAFAGKRVAGNRKIAAYVLYVAVAALYLLIRVNALGGFAPMERHAGLTTYQNIINVFPLIVLYLGKLFLPFNLNAFHVLHPVSSIMEQRAFIPLIIVVIVAFIAVVTWGRNRLAFFCIALIMVPLIPVLYIPVLGDNSFAERYLYLPSVGFTILISMLLLWSGKKLGTGMVLVTAIIILVLFSAATFSRNRVWENNFTLWSDTVKKSPDAAIAHDFMGLAYVDKGMMDEAITQFQKAIVLNPDLVTAHDNLGESYVVTGSIDRGIEELERAIRLSPGFADAHSNLGLAYWKKGLSAEAVTEYETAIRLQPRNAAAYNRLGLLYERQGYMDKAIDCFSAAAALSPDRPEFRANFNDAYRKRRDDFR
jgi:tetratricopeptide (TPR) repeat protein